jgi:Leucine-rich repeat (LRR) protein
MSLNMRNQTLPPSGGIPVALLDLKGLTFLHLAINQLEGPIPSTIDRLTALKWLDLRNNQLVASIPSTIGMLTALVHLNLGVNLLTGSVPQEMLQLKQLTEFDLYSNPKLTGLLPPFNFSQFAVCCSMGGDPFTCPLPAGAGTCVGTTLHKSDPAPTCIPACNGSSANLTANDCSTWQRFSRDPLYKEWAEGKCGPHVHTDPCSCKKTGLKTRCTDNRITFLQLRALPTGAGIPLALLDLAGLTSLDLCCNNLPGTIPSAIGKLTALRDTNLCCQRLTGTIPSTIAQLTDLTSINFGINQLEGSIPSAIGRLTGLVEIILTANQLTGSIPSTINQLTGLTRLDLGSLAGRSRHNQLTGPVPQEILQLKKLTYLTLDQNLHLTGLLPAFNFSQFTGCCAMDGDPFTCPLPAGTEKCVRCGSETHPPPTCIPACNGSSITLTANDCSAWQRFAGDPLYTKAVEAKCRGSKVHTDPCSCDGVACAAGRITGISFHSPSVPLNGTIPAVIWDFTALTDLNLAYNQLTGGIPSAGLGKLTGLTGLGLWDNDLKGTLPGDALAKLSALSFLHLSRNQLSGTIPDELTTLTALTGLYLSFNQFGGSIPSTISKLTGLTGLGLDHNQFGDSIPSTISKLTQLRVLDAGDNKLTGSIPSDIGMLNQLTNLRAGNNKLVGSIPSTIGQLVKLTSLGIFNNQHTGSVPKEMLQLKQLTSIGLQTNSLTGLLPAFNFTQLTTCDMSGNPFLCPLPVSAGECVGGPAIDKRPPPTCIPPCNGSSYNLTVNDCSAWQRFFDSTNGRGWKACSDSKLDPCSCTLPHSGLVCKDGDIIHMSLYNNGLKGTISSSIGKLTGLLYLELRANQLTGRIPSALAELKSLATLDLSTNQLTGSIPSALAELTEVTCLDLFGNKLTGLVPPLPFEQYTEECILDWAPDKPPGRYSCKEPECNHFSCPLPANSDKCKYQGGVRVHCPPTPTPPTPPLPTPTPCTLCGYYCNTLPKCPERDTCICKSDPSCTLCDCCKDPLPTPPPTTGGHDG